MKITDRLNEEIATEINRWQHENNMQRLWAGDTTLWTHSDENKWLGWLAVSAEDSQISAIEALAKEIQANGVKDVVVLGMGGSSLCPAMLAETFGKIENYPRLHILDSTDPLQIRHLVETIDLPNTLFIVSSKSGSTLEPNIFKDYFFSLLQKALNKKDVGDHFIAITDPETKLDTLAKDEHFKAIFHGVPSIGGRYSALSNFGMVPAGLMGIDVKEFLHQAEMMQQACLATIPVKENPGALLGITLGICAKQGKDKVTLIVSPGIHAFGAWLEQLLAESTGKDGKGLIPVDQEPLGSPSVYGDDRIFVYVRLQSAPDQTQDRMVEKLVETNFVVVRLNVPNRMHLGAELFRWEMATAIAGSVIGINPFNQPDVEESKILTKQLTDQYEQTGKLTLPTPIYSENGISIFTDKTNEDYLIAHLPNNANMMQYLHTYLNQIKIGDYVDLSAFIEMSNTHLNLLQQIRVGIRNNKKVATCLGFGPRFLHSTGQAYKGGPNTGVFLQITADAIDDIQIPDHRFTFGVVITAQAQGDFTVLANRSRRVLRIHLGNNVAKGLQQLHELLQHALRTSF